MKGWAIWLAAVLLLAALPLASHIQPAYAGFGTPKNLSNNTTDSLLSSTKGNQLAFSGGNVYAVWEEADANHDVFFARSINSGASFSSPVNLSNDANLSIKPQVAVVGSNVYVIWLSDLGESGEVWFTRSTDNGTNFNTPVKLSGSSVLADNPRIAAEGTYVYVAWDDPTGGNHDIFVIVGTGSGATFGTPVNVSNDSDESTLPSIAAVGFNVYVAWRSYDGIDAFTFFRMSTDRGSSYGTTMNLDESNGTSEGPEVAATGTNVHIVWLDNGPGNVDTFHAFSDDSGATFDLPTNLSSDSGDSSELTIFLSGDNAFVAWVDDSSGNGDARVALSNNGFVTSWSSNWDITTGVAATARVAAYGSTVYLFWEECVGAVCDILYMKGTHDGNNMTFDDTVNLTNDAANSFNLHAAASTDTVYIAWNSAASPAEVMFARDPDVSANAGPDQNTIEGVTVALNGTASTAPVGESLTYSWTQTAGPSVSLSGASTASPNFIAPQVSSATTLTFQLTVSSASGSSQDTVNISVNDMTGKLNLSNNAGDSFLPSIAASGTYVHAVWYDDTAGDFDIMYARSTDSGTSFSAPVNLSNDSTDSTIPFVVAVGSVVYVVWEDYTSATNHEILLKKSTDNGETFSSAVNVSNDSGFSIIPHMAALGTNVYVTWQSGVAAEYEVFFSRSTDSGASFSASANLSGNLGTSELPIVSASGTNVIVAWTDNTPGNFDIMYARSTDSGATFGSAVNLSSNSGSSDWPWVSFTGSNVYLAWQDDTSGNDEIMFSKSTDSGATFGSAVNLSSNSGSSLDPFVTSAGSSVTVTWDDASSPAEILFRHSANSGSTFDVKLNLSKNTGDSTVPEVAISGNTVYAVWEDLSAGGHEIFFTKFTIPGAVADQLGISDNTTTLKNRQPVANAGADQTVDEGNLVTLNGAASSDPDNDTLTFSWTQTGGPAVVLSSASAASPTFTAPTITSTASLTFQLVVNDGKANSAPDTVNVTVNDRKGTLTIKKVLQSTTNLLEGARFTITPNPFTLTSSLVVQDGMPEDSNAINGIILLNNVEFGTFAIEETQVPAGFARVVEEITASVHATQQSPVVIFENIPTGQVVEQTLEIPAPDLTSVEFNNFVLRGAAVNNTPVQTVNDLPQGLLVLPAEVTTLPTISFAAEAPANSSIQDLKSAYTIPIYGSPEQNLVTNKVYIIPPIVIGQQGSDNKFVMTPVLEKTLPGMTVLFDSLTPTATGSGQLKNVEMTFTSAGSVDNAAFSVGVTDTAPSGTPAPPTSILETPAMFLTVDFAGDFSGTNFSSPSAFQGSPKVRVLVDRNLNVDKLSDGCPDVSLFFFDEGLGQWTTVTKPTRVPSLDTGQYCGYELEPGHWSKFAIGGVKITANVLQSIIPGAGGGSAPGSSSSSAAPVSSGSNVNTSVSVGGKTIGLSFASIQATGNVRVSVSTPSQMPGIFSSVSGSTGKVVVAGSQGSTPYATVGTVYEIDTSGVTFSGPIEIVIPYDPSLLPPFAQESELRLLHYTGAGWEDVTVSVDTNAKVIRAKLTSLSPVVAAVIDDGTYPDSYFEAYPLKKMSIVSDKPLASKTAEEKIALSTTVKNAQRLSQDYAVIIQVLDRAGITQYVHVSTGTLERGAEQEVSETIDLRRGNYTVLVMVWSGVDSPWPLSDAFQKALKV
ncbi:PKD domain-containing protein [Nitrososphaera sp.]|uniref:PKD domain-containing protein n=1 Tax=Nitrososphaera sp. TaxID=1971748 RepID=UPI00317E4AE4